MTLASAGVAAGAVAVALPAAAGAATPEDTSVPSGAPQEMVVHVADLANGKATLMVDGGEVAVTDKVLVARIARAYAKAHQA